MKKSNQFYEAFEICLNQIFSGDETIESALDQYPDIADQLRPELEAALWIYSMRDATLMRPGYLTASRQRLVEEISQGEQTSFLHPRPVLAWKQFLFRFAFTALFLVFSVLAFRGGTQAVRASLPGDRLYDLKLAAEDVQLSLTSDAATEAELRIDLVDRRAQETADLLEKGRYEDAEIALAGYQKNLSIAAALVEEIRDKPDEKAALAYMLASTVTRHSETFTVIIATGKMPGSTVAVLTSTLVLNDEITATMVVILDELDDESIPIQVSVVPPVTGTPTPTSSSTATSELLIDTKPSATPIPSNTPTLVDSETPEPSLTPTMVASDTPQPSRTPAPPDPTDDGSDREPEPTKKPTKTPKPKKPTKTPKDKDKD